MKAIFTVFLCSLSFICLAQDISKSFKQLSEVPVKGSNSILIKTSIEDSEAFKIAGQELIEMGYTIARSDNNFFSIITANEPYKDNGFNTVIRVAVLKGNVIVRASSTSNGFSFPAEFHPKFKTVLTQTFKMIDNYGKSLASKLSQAQIVYAIE